ncbi:MAG: hypothetical protein U5K54_11745 [Cytophagales bacterium]|nr:hypothetical protein [Cytophagales bacterium]
MLLHNNLPLQYFRYNDKRGLNVYETSKEDSVGFDGVKVRVGGDFAIQYQGLYSGKIRREIYRELESNFSLPTANLNLDIQLLDGVRFKHAYLSFISAPQRKLGERRIFAD